VLLLGVSVLVFAQQEAPAAEKGSASATIAGKRIDVTYSRPLLRNRTNVFGYGGSGYGEALRAGALVWRAGANLTTVFKTEVPLVFGVQTLPAGEYGLLVDLKSPTEWTLILTSQPRGLPQPRGDHNPAELVGAQNYNPKFDAVRAPMQVDSKAPTKLEQMTISFLNVTKTGGKLSIAWENTVATVEFRVG